MAMALPSAKVDRTTTTPFYLKLFYRTGSFHRTDEFTDPLSLPPHLQIYTWPSCSLLELSHLLVSALPTLLPSPSIGTRLCFRLIFPDTTNARGNNAVVGPARYLSKDLGTLVIGDGAGVMNEDGEGDGLTGADVGGEPEKTLGDARFVIGDYVSVAVMDPLPNGGVAPPPTGPSSRGSFGMGGRGDFGGGRGRENGFGNASGFRSSRGGRGGGGFGGGFVPQGEWRRGERLPDGPAGGGGRGRGFGGGRGGGRGGRY